MGTRGGAALHGRSPPRLCERREKKCGSGWGDGFCSSHRVFHQRGGFVPRLPRQNPSRPPRADRIPRFVFMKRLLRDIFPERGNILAKSQVLQSHEAIMSFGCKIVPCGRFGAQECHFLEKKKCFHLASPTSPRTRASNPPLGGKK